MMHFLKLFFYRGGRPLPDHKSLDYLSWPAIVFSLAAIGSVSVCAEPFLSGLTQTEAIPSHVRGKVWIEALGCVACHEDGSMNESQAFGPDLTHVGDRVRPQWLLSYLSDPHKAKPGTLMPDLMTALPLNQRNETLGALLQFLMAQKAADEPSTQQINGSIENGQRLFHSIGCFACHPFGEDLKSSVWLANLQSKYHPNALASFLKDPLRVHSNGIMPDMGLTHDEASDLAVFLTGQRLSVVSTFQLESSKVEQGQRLFEGLGCAKCHTSLGTELDNGNNATMTGPGLRDVDPKKGCLSHEEGPWPDFYLSDAQIRDITAALKSRETLSESEQIQSHLVRFNCIACHERDGVGGVSESLDAFFTTSDLNLGEHGRVPPSLDGVGAKLNPVWLRKVLVQAAVARPYLNVRMPRFGATVADQVVDLFVHTDDLPSVGDIEMPNQNDSRRAGRDLAGVDGMACITCHSFKGTKTGAMGGMDLTLPGQRLTRDWFHHYMRQPQRFRPGTLMPDFWPEGHSSKPDILDGDANKQIEALWVFLSDGYSIGTPKGVHREPMRLLATEAEAVMLRRSYPGIGKRGIGVGYPKGVNLVFNAEQLCLAMIWKGDFADPAGVWLSQGHGNVRPMARQQIRFPNQPQVQLLQDARSPWPDSGERSPVHAFKGYRLDSQRRPTFLYEVEGVLIEDTFRDEAKGESVWLQREIKTNASENAGSFIIRAALGEAITKEGDHRFQVDKDLIIEVPQGVEAWVVNGSEGQELRVQIPNTGNARPLKLNYEF